VLVLATTIVFVLLIVARQVRSSRRPRTGAIQHKVRIVKTDGKQRVSQAQSRTDLGGVQSAGALKRRKRR
jgi:hypothetical protein